MDKKNGYAKNGGFLIKTDEIGKTWPTHHVFKTKEEAKQVHPFFEEVWKRMDEAAVKVNGTIYLDRELVEIHVQKHAYKQTLHAKKTAMLHRVMADAMRAKKEGRSIGENEHVLTVEEVFPAEMVKFMLGVSDKGALEMGMFAKWRLRKDLRGQWVEKVVKTLGVESRSVLRGFFSSIGREDRGSEKGFENWRGLMNSVRVLDKKVYSTLKRSTVDGRGWAEMWLEAKKEWKWDDLNWLKDGSAQYKNLPMAAHTIERVLSQEKLMTLKEKHKSWWGWFTIQGLTQDWKHKKWLSGSGFPVAVEMEEEWRATIEEWVSGESDLGVELLKTLSESDVLRPYVEEFAGKERLEACLLRNRTGMPQKETRPKSRSAL
jgi:hypothetical protein